MWVFFLLSCYNVSLLMNFLVKLYLDVPSNFCCSSLGYRVASLNVAGFACML